MDQSPTVEQARALYESGDREKAEDVAIEVLKADQKSVAAMRLLGLIARETERFDMGAQMLRFAMQLRPTDPGVAGELATCLVMGGKAEEATPLLEAVVEKIPDSAMPHFWLGRAYLEQFNGARAFMHFKRAFEIDPSNDILLSMIGLALLSAGRGREAEPWLRQYAKKNPDSVQAMQPVAASLRQQLKLEESTEMFLKILQLEPDNQAAIASVARYYRTVGRYDEALAMVREGLERLGPRPALASVFGTLAERSENIEEGIGVVTAALEELSETEDRPQQKIGLHFTLGKLREHAKDYDGAWECYTTANSYFPPNYQGEASEARTEGIRSTLNSWTIGGLPRATIPTDRPIFVVGMPRSGTTLVEQILSSHPECFGAGELLVIPQLARELCHKLGGVWPLAIAGLTQEQADEYAQRYLDHLQGLDESARRVVDKLPHNFQYVGLMSLLFPEARVIHCIRNPLDVLVSNYGTPLSAQHTWRPRLETLAHAYNQYREIMEHYRENAPIPILDVVYEDTVAEVEKQARRILDFVGLEWNDQCLEFYKHSRAVTTASTDQVRQPIYQSSKERWRRYEKHLGPLIEALEAGGTNIERPFEVERL